MQRLLYLIISVFGVLFLQSVWADSTATEHLIRDLKDNQSLKGSFEQTIGTDTAAMKSSGTFALQRPGLFNWTTTSPNKQRIVADSKNIYTYDEDLAQITISDQKNTAKSGSPAIFLVGNPDKIAANYAIQETNKSNQVTYTITPNSATQAGSLFNKLAITFTKQGAGNKIDHMNILDSLGDNNTIIFTRLSKNPEKKLFIFTRPAGVEVVGTK